VKAAQHVLLAMQKVEGSNPISRFKKGLRLQALLVPAVGWCVCPRVRPQGWSAHPIAIA
jgi:hypothetical protein